MNNLIWSILELNALIIILYFCFVLIRKRISYTAQRVSLMTIPLLAVLVSFSKTIIGNGQELIQIPVIELSAIEVGAVTNHTTQLNLIDYYWLVCAVLLAFIIIRIIRVLHLLKSSGLKNKESFSFFSAIHIKDDLEGKERRFVLEHEKIHVRKMHSLDLIIYEIIHAFNWFNPVYFLIKKDLKRVHEFEVDSVMYNLYKTDYMKYLLSYSLGTSSNIYLLTNQFYNEVMLKKRIKNMNDRKKRGWKMMIAIPMIASATALISWTEVKTVETISIVDQKIEENLDVEPSFNGGMEAMGAYMAEAVVYPESAKKAGTEGTVFVEFVVLTTGELSKVTVLKGVSEDIDQSALDAVKGMPNWIPGEKDGKKVNAKMVLPIKYVL